MSNKRKINASGKQENQTTGKTGYKAPRLLPLDALRGLIIVTGL